MSAIGGTPSHEPPPVGVRGRPPHLPPPMTLYTVAIGAFPPVSQEFSTLDQALTYVRSHFQSRDHSVTISVRVLFSG